jgi:hypothetical protein
MEKTGNGIAIELIEPIEPTELTIGLREMNVSMLK